MNGFNVMFTKSTDHGATWSAPVKTYGKCRWNDKPILAVSDDGQDVYVAFNGPTGGDPWVAQSHDVGRDVDAGEARRQRPLLLRLRRATSRPTAPSTSRRSSLLYGGGGNKGTTPTGTIDEHVLHLAATRGASWTDRLVGAGPARARLHRGRLHARLLPRPHAR